MDLEGTSSSPTVPGAKPVGFVLVVAAPSAQGSLQAQLRHEGFESFCIDEPYTALVELLAKPLVYRGVVLSLQGLYREELAVIRTIRTRLPHLEVWLAHTDGRQAAMAEGMRLGAAGLLSDEGLHALADREPGDAELARVSAMAATHANAERGSVTDSLAEIDERVREERPAEPDELPDANEPILTADELRALLADQPSSWPSEGG